MAQRGAGPWRGALGRLAQGASAGARSVAGAWLRAFACALRSRVAGRQGRRCSRGALRAAVGAGALTVAGLCAFACALRSRVAGLSSRRCSSRGALRARRFVCSSRLSTRSSLLAPPLRAQPAPIAPAPRRYKRVWPRVALLAPAAPCPAPCAPAPCSPCPAPARSPSFGALTARHPSAPRQGPAPRLLPFLRATRPKRRTRPARKALKITPLRAHPPKP